MSKQPCPVVFFEIGCKSSEKTKAFYNEVFGWNAAPGIINDGLPGISGHINSLGHEPHNYVMVYIEVEDVAAYIEKAEAAGGKKIVGPIPLPNGKTFAWINDVEGNLIGLLA